MIIAAAQIQSTDDPSSSNLEAHYRLIHLAAQQGVQLLIFPEMSVTGYTRKNAARQSYAAQDNRWEKLKNLACEYQMTLVVGAPLKAAKQLYIASWIFHPDGQQAIYTKRFLHQGEEKYFAASLDHNPQWSWSAEKIALAICADIDHPSHPQAAKANDCTLYLASIFFSREGIAEGHQTLAAYAKEHQMNVLMANFTGAHWNIVAGGKSAFWNQQGQLVAALAAEDTGLLIVQAKEGLWTPVLHQSKVP